MANKLMRSRCQSNGCRDGWLIQRPSLTCSVAPRGQSHVEDGERWLAPHLTTLPDKVRANDLHPAALHQTAIDMDRPGSHYVTWWSPRRSADTTKLKTWKYPQPMRRILQSNHDFILIRPSNANTHVLVLFSTYPPYHGHHILVTKRQQRCLILTKFAQLNEQVIKFSVDFRPAVNR